MANLKELKNRITSVTSTQKITKAMKMVAAAKLRHAEEAARAARPYAERMDAMMVSLATGLEGQEGPRLLQGSGSDQRHLLIVATGERGLCGGFNSSIARAAGRQIDALVAAGKDVKILCVGKKGRDALKRKYGHLIIDFIDLSASKRISFGDAQPIAQQVLAMFDNEEFDVCSMFFSKYVSVLTQIVTNQQLIPASIPDASEVDAENEVDYDYEPEEEEILADLLPRNISVQVYKGLLENSASEQGARMSAMDSATRNAGEMIDKLTLQYNRERQAAITSELIEIISGAEAL